LSQFVEAGATFGSGETRKEEPDTGGIVNARGGGIAVRLRLD
jgi:hypothetical protein